MNDNKKEKLFTVNFLLILIECLSGKFVTKKNDKFAAVHNKCLIIPPSTSAQYSIRVRISRDVSDIFALIYVGSCIQEGSEQLVSSLHLYFVNLGLCPAPQTIIRRK